MRAGEVSLHRRAAEAFVTHISEEYDEVVSAVRLLGSVPRGQERGVASDVDLLVMLSDHADPTTATETIRELASDIELEYAVVLSLIVVSEKEYERRADRPFSRNLSEQAAALYGCGHGHGHERDKSCKKSLSRCSPPPRRGRE